MHMLVILAVSPEGFPPERHIFYTAQVDAALIERYAAEDLLLVGATYPREPRHSSVHQVYQPTQGIILAKGIKKLQLTFEIPAVIHR